MVVPDVSPNPPLSNIDPGQKAEHQDLSSLKLNLLSLKETIPCMHWAKFPASFHVPTAKFGVISGSLQAQTATNMMGGGLLPMHPHGDFMNIFLPKHYLSRPFLPFISNGPDSTSDTNLVGAAAKELFDTYLYLTEVLLQIPDVTPNMQIVCPGGHTALWAAVACAQVYQKQLHSLREGVLCSTSTHRAIPDLANFTLNPTYISTITLGDKKLMNPDEVISVLERKRPASVVITGGRTTDGIIENADGFFEYCLEHKIPIILDLSAATPIPFLADKPLYEGDIGPDLKKQYAAILNCPAVKFVVSGWGKFVGQFGLSTLMATHVGEDSELMNAFWEVAHLESYGYFTGNGDFGGTSLNGRLAIDTVETLAALGPWPLRYFTNHAKLSAYKVQQGLEALGHETIATGINRVLVKLPPGVNYREVQRNLIKNWELSAAASDEKDGYLRFQLNIPIIFTNNDIQFLINAIDSSIKGETRSGLGQKPIATEARVTYSHLLATKEHFTEQLPFPREVKEAEFHKVYYHIEEIADILASIEMNLGQPTSRLTEMLRLVQGYLAKPNRSKANQIRVEQLDPLRKDMPQWFLDFRDGFKDLVQDINKFHISNKSIKQKHYELLSSLRTNSRKLQQDMYSELQAFQRYDRFALSEVYLESLTQMVLRNPKLPQDSAFETDDLED